MVIKSNLWPILGLKQLPRTWYGTFLKCISVVDFKLSLFDGCLFIKKEKLDSYICLYVDDILILGNKQQVEAVRKYLQEHSDMKFLGDASVFIGIEIHRDRLQKSVSIGQKAFAESTFEKI